LLNEIKAGDAALLGAVADPVGPGDELFDGVFDSPEEVGPEATSEALGCGVSPDVPDLWPTTINAAATPINSAQITPRAIDTFFQTLSSNSGSSCPIHQQAAMDLRKILPAGR
jgi:hypothetical protein